MSEASPGRPGPCSGEWSLGDRRERNTNPDVLFDVFLCCAVIGVAPHEIPPPCTHVSIHQEFNPTPYKPYTQRPEQISPWCTSALLRGTCTYPNERQKHESSTLPRRAGIRGWPPASAACHAPDRAVAVPLRALTSACRTHAPSQQRDASGRQAAGRRSTPHRQSRDAPWWAHRAPGHLRASYC